MPRTRELIEQAAGAAEESVTTAKSRYLDQVRGVLRDLTRLKFTERKGVESQRTSVPISVVAGLPTALERMGDQDLPSGDRSVIEVLGLWEHDINSLRVAPERLKPLTVRLSRIPGWQDRGEGGEILVHWKS